MLVRARTAAIVAGLISSLYLMLVVAVHGVPDTAVALFGGPTGVARHGGLVLRYRPPAGADLTRFRVNFEGRGGTVRRDDGVLVVELTGVAKPEADRVAAGVTQGGLEFREVLEDSSLAEVAVERRGGDDYVAPGVRRDIDTWRDDASGGRHREWHLSADGRDQLEDAFAQLRAAGWVQPDHSIVAFERMIDSATRRVRWRSYLLGDVLLDGDAVDHATRSVDPNTGLPLVVLDFTREGGRLFAEITARIVGHKLASVLGGQVQSAPIIMSMIRDRAQITVGRGDLVDQEREADAVVAMFDVVALPQGGTIEDQRWVAPADLATTLLLAIVATGLAGGVLIGLAIWLVIRVARPVWRPRPRSAGRLPIRRLAITLLAPVALIALGNLPLPGVNQEEVFHIVRHAGSAPAGVLGVATLGLAPIISAFLLVELATLVTARGRRARYRPASRVVLGRYVAALGIVFAVIQSYFAVAYLDQISSPDVEIVAPGRLVHAAIMASMVSGTLLLVIVAGMIRQHGLGNGYGALLVSDWALRQLSPILDQPVAGHALGLVTLALIGVATVALLRMRLTGDGEASLRVPSSGSVPLASSRGVIMQLSLMFQLGVVSASSDVMQWLHFAEHQIWILAGAVVVLVPLWSLAFSRPGVIAPLAANTDLAPPSRTSWRRATLLSLVFLLGIGGAAQLSAAVDSAAQPICEASAAMMFVAVLLDLVDDLRARRRRDLVAVWPLQHPQYAELVQRVLSDAGIACHLQSSHLRTMLAWFGPHVPIDVLVPAASADDAHRKISAVFQEVPVSAVFA